jgi:hypothetical protein
LIYGIIVPIKIIIRDKNILKLISASITNHAEVAPIGPVSGYIKLIRPKGSLLKA